MSCGTCIRWRRLQPKPKDPPGWFSRYGACRWPGVGPKPYWTTQHPTGDILVHETHGAECAAFKERRR